MDFVRNYIRIEEASVENAEYPVLVSAGQRLCRRRSSLESGGDGARPTPPVLIFPLERCHENSLNYFLQSTDKSNGRIGRSSSPYPFDVQKPMRALQ